MSCDELKACLWGAHGASTGHCASSRLARFALVMSSRTALVAFCLILAFGFLGKGQNVFVSVCFILK